MRVASHPNKKRPRRRDTGPLSEKTCGLSLSFSHGAFSAGNSQQEHNSAAGVPFELTVLDAPPSAACPEYEPVRTTPGMAGSWVKLSKVK